jgi:hypothetical protein
VYLTDKELAGYLASPRNGLSDIFGLPCGSSLVVNEEYFAGRAPTLLKAMGNWPGRAVLTAITCDTLATEHFLRIYLIESAITPVAERTA